MKGRYLGYFGSFCWAGAAVESAWVNLLKKSKFEIVGDPVEMKQAMKDITYEQCELLARAMDRTFEERQEIISNYKLRMSLFPPFHLAYFVFCNS